MVSGERPHYIVAGIGFEDRCGEFRLLLRLHEYLGLIRQVDQACAAALCRIEQYVGLDLALGPKRNCMSPFEACPVAPSQSAVRNCWHRAHVE